MSLVPRASAFSRPPPTRTNMRSASISDQNGLYPKNVAASMLKQIGNSIYDSIKQIEAGKAPFGTLEIYGLKNDGVGLVYNDALVPEAVKAKVDDAKAKVLSGEIKVDSAFKTNEPRPAAPGAPPLFSVQELAP